MALSLSHLLLELGRYRSLLASTTSSSPVLVIRGWNLRDRIAIVAQEDVGAIRKSGRNALFKSARPFVSILLEKRSGRQHNSLAALKWPRFVEKRLRRTVVRGLNRPARPIIESNPARPTGLLNPLIQ